LHNCFNQFNSWLRSNFEYVVVGFKIGTSSKVLLLGTNVDRDGNVVLGCYKLPPMECRSYFINVLNMCGLMPTQLCVQPWLLGWMLGC
jgi:hypothetical protein